MGHLYVAARLVNPIPAIGLQTAQKLRRFHAQMYRTITLLGCYRTSLRVTNPRGVASCTV